jgi:hypothetical protein
MIATKGLLTVDEQIEILKLAKKRLPNLSWSHSSAGICLAIKKTLFDKSEKLYNTACFCGINVLIPSFTQENAVLSKIGEVRSCAYWWSTELSKGGLTNRLAFLDWLINELEKSKTIK